MGLFTKIKKMFDKSIEIGDECDAELVHLYSRSQAVFNIGYEMTVRSGFYAVFVAKDRVTDVLPQGTYRLVKDTLPLTFKRLRLDNPKAKKARSKFKADLYFVNTKLFKDVEFCGEQPYYSKTKEFGRVVAYSAGTCGLQVENAGNLIAWLLIDRPYVTNKIALKTLSLVIGDECNKILSKSKMTIKDIFQMPRDASMYVCDRINPLIRDYGVSVHALELKSFDINSRVKQQLNACINGDNAENKDVVVFNESNDVESPKFVVANSEGEVGEASTVTTESPETENVESVTTFEQLKTITCPSCNEKIPYTSHFCPNCGFNLDELKSGRD